MLFLACSIVIQASNSNFSKFELMSAWQCNGTRSKIKYAIFLPLVVVLLFDTSLGDGSVTVDDSGKGVDGVVRVSASVVLVAGPGPGSEVESLMVDDASITLLGSVAGGVSRTIHSPFTEHMSLISASMDSMAFGVKSLES